MAYLIQQDSDAPTLRPARTLLDVPGMSLARADNITVVTPGSMSDSYEDDLVIHSEVDPVYYNEGQVIVTPDGSPATVPTFRSLDEGIATVDEVGNITRVSDGVARILVTILGVTRRIDVDVTQQEGDGATVIGYDFVPGTLGYDAAYQIDSRIAGKNMATHGRIFSSQDHVNDVFVRNPDFWGADLDLTCISPSNSNANHRKSGTALEVRDGEGALHNRFVLIAAHYEFPVGTKIYFVTMDGTTIERTVASKVRHPEYNPYFPDLTICCLNEDLPETIKPCKVLPGDWADYLVNAARGRPPALCLDQEEKGLVADAYAFGSLVSFATPQKADRLVFHESKISGDSGNPAFFLLDPEGTGTPELVLLTCWTFGGAGSGTFVTPQISDLNAMINTANADAGFSEDDLALVEIDLNTGLPYTTIDYDNNYEEGLLDPNTSFTEVSLNSIQLTQSSANPYAGTYSLRITDNNSSGGGIRRINGLVESTYYIVTGYYRSDGIGTAAVDIGDAGGIGVSPVASTTSTEWTYFELGPFRPSATRGFVDLSLSGSPSGWAEFDNIVIRRLGSTYTPS